MSSLNLSENYYQRKCFLKKNQVPTQSQIIKKMQKPLADVYFSSMTPKLKMVAGIQPPMQGGGADWYMPPTELLKGRAVLKPIKKEYLAKLGYRGIEYFSEKITQEYRMSLAKERIEKLEENDKHWKQKINHRCHILWDEFSNEAAKRNTNLISTAFQQYSDLYATNINKIEHLLLQAARKEIEDNREQAYQKMLVHYEKLLKDQACMLYSRYTKKLETLKTERKNKFIAEVEELRTDLGNQIHQIRYEKHLTLEKFRAVMECQNLACQLYVAMKEQQEHDKEIDEIKQKHKKKIKEFKKEIAKTEFEINIETKKDKERQEVNSIWQKKICKVVKSFQDFIGYCLNAMPEHADFFLDIEKLLLLQLDEAIDNPNAESLIVSDDGYTTPVARPHPFYLVCDKGYKPTIDANLCPKHCTSSASQLPVIVVNKQYIYSACDNAAVIADKLEELIKDRQEQSDLEDDHSYTNDIPIKYSKSQNILELQLQSSLMQIIQKEIPNLKNLPIYCCDCHLPHCYLPLDLKEKICPVRARTEGNATRPYDYYEEEGSPGIKTGRSVELKHEREPKIESYLDFVRPQVCRCFKTAQKHLNEHLPPYMVKMSAYEPPELPNYEACSMETLRNLVQKARGIGKKPPKPETLAIESNAVDASTQCEDEQFQHLCNCFAEEELEKLFQDLAKERLAQEERSAFKLLDGKDMELTSSHLKKSPSMFAMEQAFKLREVVKCPQIQEIFKRSDCEYFDKKYED